jgi:hypothetical protein
MLFWGESARNEPRCQLGLDAKEIREITRNANPDHAGIMRRAKGAWRSQVKPKRFCGTRHHQRCICRLLKLSGIQFAEEGQRQMQCRWVHPAHTGQRWHESLDFSAQVAAHLVM